MHKNAHSKYINNTGGTDILIKHLSQIKFWEQIDSTLGKRNARAEYSYSDVLQTWTMNIISGSKRLEHSTEHSFKFAQNPFFKKGMSPDTISRVMRKLAVPNIYYGMVKSGKRNQLTADPSESEKLKLHEVNDNIQLNELLLDVAISLGLFDRGKSYEVDIDATIVPTKVSDSRAHYKKDGTGYCPMIVFLGGIPIYFVEKYTQNVYTLFFNKSELAASLFKSQFQLTLKYSVFT